MLLGTTDKEVYMAELLTTKELAQELKVTKTIVYRLTRSRKIPVYKIGNRNRYIKEDVLKALKIDSEK